MSYKFVAYLKFKDFCDNISNFNNKNLFFYREN